jgi:hypothetical protein
VTVYAVEEPIAWSPALVTPGWSVPQANQAERTAHARAVAEKAERFVPADVLASVEAPVGEAGAILAERSEDVDLLVCGTRGYFTDKVLAIVFPISAFVALGFEHSVANMYFLPMGVLVRERASEAFWAETDLAAGEFPHVTWGDALLANLLPVTLGNVLGGSLMVGLVYWAVYLRRR